MAAAIGTPAHYHPYLTEVINRLDWKADPEQVVWHYTNGTGLIGIVKS